MGEQELKFHVPRQASHSLRHWLDRAFRPHRRHPVSTICSIYFDTASRRSFREKESSDYRKTKYRIRWYADAGGIPLDVPAFLEIKEKHGSARRKYRTVLPMAPKELLAAPLADPMWHGFFQRFQTGDAPVPRLELHPFLELRYCRHRYTHPLFPDAFCLDSEIHCVRTHPAHLPPARSTPLDHDVFEQKGKAQDPLPVLRPLPRFDVQRSSVSKYFLAILQLQPDCLPA